MLRGQALATIFERESVLLVAEVELVLRLNEPLPNGGWSEELGVFRLDIVALRRLAVAFDRVRPFRGCAWVIDVVPVNEDGFVNVAGAVLVPQVGGALPVPVGELFKVAHYVSEVVAVLPAPLLELRLGHALVERPGKPVGSAAHRRHVCGLALLLRKDVLIRDDARARCDLVRRVRMKTLKRVVIPLVD